MTKSKKAIVAIVSVVSTVVLLWAGMIATDTVKSKNFEEPVFAKAEETSPDGLSRNYSGIGYTVYMEDYTDADGNTIPCYSEVKLFGKMISAVIT